MTKRSVANRNLWGGFWGGVLGILSFGLIHQYLLPIGCLLGVVSGYWYQEICQEIIRSWQQTLARWGEEYAIGQKKLRSMFQRQSALLKKVKKFLQSHNLEFNLPIKEILALLRHFFTISNSPIVKWLRAHPMNRFYTIKGLVWLSHGVIHLLWFIPLCKFWISTANDPEPEKFILLMLGVISIFSIMFCIAITSFNPEKTLYDMKNYYRQYELFNQKGPIYTYFYTFIALAIRQITVFLGVAGVLSYGLISGIIVSTIIFLPVIAFLGIIKALYKISLRTNHWLCLGITLIVTTAMALITKSYLGYPLLIWLIALITGCLSGLTTEGLRRLIAWDFAKNTRLTNYALEPITKQLAPTGKKFVRSCEWVSDKLAQGFNY
ncbi:MAG: hypothetical protein GF365_04870 [Candidatus Buchananbacteria bacterium]|nr:hypothetical protein [Candidatus Buchananbacteria bacterium]